MNESKINTIIKNISSPRQWFNIEEETEIPTVMIYDMIGSSMWEESISPKGFINGCKEIEKKHKEINIRINSPGGVVHDALAIYNYLTQSPLKKNVYIDGIAASAASFIAMAGDKIYMPETAEIMIHNAWGFMMGDASDFRKEAEHLDALTKIIGNIYVTKTKKSIEEISEMMNVETWMNGKEAAEKGFIDETLKVRAAACSFELSNDLFPNIPKNFIKYQNALKKRIQENELRDAGHSRNEAKELIAKQRDADKEDSCKIKQQAEKYFINKLKELNDGK